MRGAGLHHLGAMPRRLAPEDHQVEERVRSQAVRAVHRYAGRLADRHQARNDDILALAPVHDFALHVAGDAAHVVVDRGQHRNRLLVHVDVGEDARGLGDAGQPLLDDLRTQVLEVQVNVVLELADSAALANLDGHRAAHDVARGQVLGVRRVALHEALAHRVREITALAARAFGDETAGAVDAGRVELHELHVLQRQAGAQHHAAAVARAGMRGGAGEPRAAIAAGREDDLVRAKPMQRAFRHVERDHAAAFAIFHDQIEREVLDEERGVVLQRLLIQGVQHGVAGAIGRRAGALRDALAVVRGHSAERTLIDLAFLRARERHAVMLELDDRGGRHLAHELDGILIAEPIGALHGVIHVPAPVVLAHVAERGGNAALRGDGVAARRKYLGQAGGGEPGLGQPEGRAQSRAAGADHHHVIGVVDELVFAHGLL